jgi:putative FmdB family regulatory protein
MPIYEYECSKCGHYLEALQKFSDPPLRQCPECGKRALERLVSAPMFRLSGSGWYETDFKSDKETKRNLAGEKGGEEPAKTTASDGGEKSAPPASAAKSADAGDSKAKPKRTAKPVAKPAVAKARTRPASAKRASGRSGQR